MRRFFAGPTDAEKEVALKAKKEELKKRHLADEAASLEAQKKARYDAVQKNDVVKKDAQAVDPNVVVTKEQQLHLDHLQKLADSYNKSKNKESFHFAKMVFNREGDRHRGLTAKRIDKNQAEVRYFGPSYADARLHRAFMNKTCSQETKDAKAMQKEEEKFAFESAPKLGR